MKPFLFFFAALFLAFPARAHEGHDHDAAAAGLKTEAAPRAVAQSEAFELVAVLAQGQLTLYLDRFADNAPVADAEIEIESGPMKAVARQVAPGVYALSGERFASPGKHLLTFTVQSGEDADLLTASLDIDAGAATSASGWSAWAAWGGVGALLLAGTTLFALRRKKNREEWK